MNGGAGQVAERARSKSVMDGRTQFTREGRAIVHFGECAVQWTRWGREGSANYDAARAMYTYQAAIPEELSFAKGDVLAVLRLQDDGWWEAEVTGKNGARGLVPSNYLVAC